MAVSLAALSCSLMLGGCKKKPEKIDLSSTHTSAAETMAETTAAPETTAPAASSAAADTASDAAIENAASSNGGSSTNSGTGAASTVKNLSTKIETYTSGKVSIQYPSLSNADASVKKDAIDKLLKDNALSAIAGYNVNEAKDTLAVTCKVLSADRNRITAIYTGTYQAEGAAYPTNLFYSNTIDVNKAANLGFSKFADPYTMAGYVLSSDCVFPQADAALKTELMKAKNEQSIEYYTNLFNSADFTSAGKFPASFSYEHEGNIYFSIPVTHALGDVAIVMYTPENK